MLTKIFLFFFVFATTFSFAGVTLSIPSNNRITYMKVDMVVPPKPPAHGTLFLWPGLQPGGANYNPINNGVLQSVLTWGPSCAPISQPPRYSTWWISGQYVNTFGNYPGYTGCKSGPEMAVNPGDVLTIKYSLYQDVWTQTIYNHNTAQQVAYHINMLNQSQNYAIFSIEPYDNATLGGNSLYFHNIVIRFANQLPSGPSIRESHAYVSPPVLSNYNRTCKISEIILHQ